MCKLEYNYYYIFDFIYFNLRISKILLTENNKLKLKTAKNTFTLMDNHLQIFSLKSNLMANAQGKGGVNYFNNQKYNPHTRMKSLCFSNMLQTIRNNYGK